MVNRSFRCYSDSYQDCIVFFDLLPFTLAQSSETVPVSVLIKLTPEISDVNLNERGSTSKALVTFTSTVG